MGLILQIVPLDMTVADRWFYFPIVGLLGILGVILQLFYPSIKKHYKIFFYGALIILSFYSLRTFIRTLDWKNDLILYAHDLKEESNSYLLSDLYAQELLSKYGDSKIQEFCFYENKSVNEFPTAVNINELGDCYLIKGQYNDAVAEYKQAISLLKTYNKDAKNPYVNLANALLKDQDYQGAIDFLNTQALKTFPNDAVFYCQLATAYTGTDDYTNALKSAQHCYKLAPNDTNKQFINQILQSKQTNSFDLQQ